MKAVATRTAPRGQEASLPTAPPLGLHRDFFPLSQFEEFYREVVRLKSQPSGPSALSPDETHKRLLLLLNTQEDRVSSSSTLLGLEMYRQAQRVMACLADEIFSALRWPSGSKWRPLEWSLFPDHYVAETSPDNEPSAERLFFSKLGLLLQQRDPAYRGLAAVYFYALALGLYREHQQNHRKDPHNDYLDRLFRMISHAENGVFRENSRPFEQAYSHTLSEAKIVNLPSPRKWLLLLASLILAWIVASSALWVYVSYPVSEKLHELQRAFHR
jgi:type VI secretion system protein ImpK